MHRRFKWDLSYIDLPALVVLLPYKDPPIKYPVRVYAMSMKVSVKYPVLSPHPRTLLLGLHSESAPPYGPKMTQKSFIIQYSAIILVRRPM